MEDPSAKSGYYREIARTFLERRGGALFLSARDQAVIADWEGKRIPLDVVLEGIGRTFDGLRARGRNARPVSLAFCDRDVEAAFAQHRDRAAGRRKDPAAAPGPGRRERARREIAKSLDALPAGDAGMRSLLRSALAAVSAAEPDEAALERLDAAIEDELWAGTTAAEKTQAAAEARKSLKGRSPAGLEEAVRRHAVLSARARRRLPHVSLHYY